MYTYTNRFTAKLLNDKLRAVVIKWKLAQAFRCLRELFVQKSSYVTLTPKLYTVRLSRIVEFTTKV